MTADNTNEKAASPSPSRYQWVKEILNKAAGESCPSYQGYGRFWNLPLAEFLEISIYGVRMIAPADTGGPPHDDGTTPPATEARGGGCCHAEAPPAPPPPATSDDSCCATPSGDSGKKYPGRGAASGLIKGLRGQYPFDGSQFPRLPWGGAPVAAGDIQFISDWIDAGCPGTDEDRSAIEIRESQIAARARGDEEHPLSPRTTNQHRHDAGVLKARKNISYLPADELQRFRVVIREMHKYDNYFQDERGFNYWARIHANSCQHGWEEFLTWHRLYLYHFEQQMQDVDPSVTLPYWDWTDSQDVSDQADVQASILDMSATQPLDNGIIPIPYRCWITAEAITNLQKTGRVSAEDIHKLERIIFDPKKPNETTYNSGNRLFAAAGISYGSHPDSDNAILDELQRVNPLWHRFRWPGGNSSVIFEAYPTPSDIDNILKIPNFFNFGSGPSDHHFFGAVENIHNLLHNFSGGANPAYKANQPSNPNEPQYGDMVAPGTTAFDLIFWGHHSNVDRLWWEWQKLHPNANPDNLTAILPPWTMNVGDTLNATRLGYEYVKSAHLYETDNTVPITRFKSAKANVHPDVLAHHGRAEIRLHKAQYSINGGTFIRVFLNAPNADVNTPTKGNAHFVGQVQLFSGGCIGGPGHCDPPPDTKRKFDLRPRHRKTPFNIHLDATDTVSTLRTQGATDLHVNLVVMDVTGQPLNNALWLDAVSLNFFD